MDTYALNRKLSDSRERMLFQHEISEFATLSSTCICYSLANHEFNPLTAGVAYIIVLSFLLAHEVPFFKYVEDKM